MMSQSNVQVASGKFKVSIKPEAESPKQDGSTLGRLALDKQFSGELEAVGKGEMLTATTDTKGSAAYVAMERISGTLKGRKGSFVVHHNGVMSGGAQQLAIAIVPDSGSGELAGISGTMSIKVTGGEHFYELSYRLP